MDVVCHDLRLLKIIFNNNHIFETLTVRRSYLTIREKVDWKAGV
jgi:hypothetical protein